MKTYRRLVHSSQTIYYFAKEINYYRNYISNRKYGFKEKDIVVCGMKRSGSTLLYNILEKMLELKVKPGKGFFYYTNDYIGHLENENFFFLRKTHNYSSLLRKRIVKGYSLAFFTHRNLLDMIASNVEKGWITNIDKFINEGYLNHYVSEALLYKKIKKLNLIRYDELFSNKRNIITIISKQLNLQLNEEDLLKLIEETSVESTIRRMDKMDFESTGRNKVNHKSGLHNNHISNPTQDKWKNVLSNKEASIIKSSKPFLDYNKEFNYD